MARYLHVTSPVNRESIREHGLDWRHMGATHGVAGVEGVSSTPEAPGIFLCEDDWGEVEWFAEMAVGQGHAAVDVWEVELPNDAEFVQYDGSPGYSFHPRPIPRTAVRLIRADWAPKSRFRD
jgi:hypothetical protein